MKSRKPGFWFQLSVEEREEWKQLASELGLTVAQLIRNSVAQVRESGQLNAVRRKRAVGA